MSSSRRFYLNENLFFLIEEGNVLVWNYQNHQQYVLELPYFEALQRLAKGEPFDDDKILTELLDGGLISTQVQQKVEWGWDKLSYIYHIGTQNVDSVLEDAGNPDEFVKSYIEHSATTIEKPLQLFQEKVGKTIDLPKPDVSLFENKSFYSVLKARKTSREFYGEPVTLLELSTILHASFGLINGTWNELEENNLKAVALHKASPSGGGLHPEEAYVVVYRVEGLDPGIYYYQVRDHKLTLLKVGDFEKEVIAINFNQFYAKGTAFGIFITARFDKTWWKYSHSRAYRVVLLDIGHVSQTFLLCATALGLNTWLTAAFKDDELHRLLGIDGINEGAIFYVAAGKGSNKAIPEKMLQYLRD